MPPSKSADYNRRGDAHHPAATVSLFPPFSGLPFFIKTGESVRMMFALSAEYEMAALIASILFGFGAAVWFWMELH
ncbi:MAG: hypothetical protein ACJZ8W_10330 [Limisphaerales bacterium]